MNTNLKTVHRSVRFYDKNIVHTARRSMLSAMEQQPSKVNDGTASSVSVHSSGRTRQLNMHESSSGLSDGSLKATPFVNWLSRVDVATPPFDASSSTACSKDRSRTIFHRTTPIVLLSMERSSHNAKGLLL